MSFVVGLGVVLKVGRGHGGRAMSNRRRDPTKGNRV